MCSVVSRTVAKAIYFPFFLFLCVSQLRGNPTLSIYAYAFQKLKYKEQSSRWIGAGVNMKSTKQGEKRVLTQIGTQRSKPKRGERESSHLSNSPNNLHGYNILGLDTFLSIDTQSVEDILQPTSARTNPNQWTDASQLNNNKEAQLPPLKSIHYQDEVCRCRYCCLRGFRQCLCPI